MIYLMLGIYTGLIATSVICGILYFVVRHNFERNRRKGGKKSE